MDTHVCIVFRFVWAYGLTYGLTKKRQTYISKKSFTLYVLDRYMREWWRIVSQDDRKQGRVPLLRYQWPRCHDRQHSFLNVVIRSSRRMTLDTEQILSLQLEHFDFLQDSNEIAQNNSAGFSLNYHCRSETSDRTEPGLWRTLSQDVHYSQGQPRNTGHCSEWVYECNEDGFREASTPYIASLLLVVPSITSSPTT